MASNSKVVKFLKSTNKFGVIIDFILYAIRFSFAFVLLSLVLLVFGLKHWAVTIAWLSLGAVALAATFRAIDIATVVLRSEATKRE
ncbi:MAG: hypothetical protein M1598_04565 [Actinobacteria bacterium]|nr:hypothetical protein [Actinomycetota bacterium]